jgi:hypothetical protein
MDLTVALAALALGRGTPVPPVLVPWYGVGDITRTLARLRRNKWVRDKPCTCWTKVGLGRESLPVTYTNFQKPWFFIDMRRGRVSDFYWDLKFVD